MEYEIYLSKNKKLPINSFKNASFRTRVRCNLLYSKVFVFKSVKMKYNAIRKLRDESQT